MRKVLRSLFPVSMIVNDFMQTEALAPVISIHISLIFHDFLFIMSEFLLKSKCQFEREDDDKF